MKKYSQAIRRLSWAPKLRMFCGIQIFFLKFFLNEDYCVENRAELGHLKSLQWLLCDFLIFFIPLQIHLVIRI